MIRFLLLHRIEWTNAHPKTMFACAAICAFIALAAVGDAP